MAPPNLVSDQQTRVTPTTRCLLLCGGNNSRWAGYRNTARKHLVEIEGEILLRRTLRLVAAFAPTRTVVVVNQKDLAVYASALPPETEFFWVNPHVGRQTEASKFLSSKGLWNPKGRTIVLLGDVWLSKAALARIFDHSRLSRGNLLWPVPPKVVPSQAERGPRARALRNTPAENCWPPLRQCHCNLRWHVPQKMVVG